MPKIPLSATHSLRCDSEAWLCNQHIWGISGIISQGDCQRTSETNGPKASKMTTDQIDGAPLHSFSPSRTEIYEKKGTRNDVR